MQKYLPSVRRLAYVATVGMLGAALYGLWSIREDPQIVQRNVTILNYVMNTQPTSKSQTTLLITGRVDCRITNTVTEWRISPEFFLRYSEPTDMICYPPSEDTSAIRREFYKPSVFLKTPEESFIDDEGNGLVESTTRLKDGKLETKDTDPDANTRHSTNTRYNLYLGELQRSLK